MRDCTVVRKVRSRTFEGLLIRLQKMAAENAAPHDDEIRQKPRDLWSDGTGAHASPHAAASPAVLFPARPRRPRGGRERRGRASLSLPTTALPATD